jgi:hypothetical protein
MLTRVAATTVTDAGTDAKVAKFLKRGMEIADWATIEAHELSATGQRLARELSPPITTAAAPPTAEAPDGKAAEKTGLLGKLKRFSIQRTKPPSTTSLSATPAAAEAQGLGLFRTRTPDPSSPAAALAPEAGPSTSSARPHAAGYAWSVTKWTRTDLVGHEADVSLEWRKRRRSAAAKRERALRRRSLAEPTSASPNGLSPPRPSNASAKRRSVDLGRIDHLAPPSESDHGSPMLGGGGGGGEGGGSSAGEATEDDESDPEDSESPWIADLVLRSARHRIATLSPAPFHAKLVAQLAVVGTLTPMAVDDAKGVALSVEELKDAVACTALWLVVRESLGGIAKTRKGDGRFRITAKP